MSPSWERTHSPRNRDEYGACIIYGWSVRTGTRYECSLHVYVICAFNIISPVTVRKLVCIPIHIIIEEEIVDKTKRSMHSNTHYYLDVRTKRSIFEFFTTSSHVSTCNPGITRYNEVSAAGGGAYSESEAKAPVGGHNTSSISRKSWTAAARRHLDMDESDEGILRFLDSTPQLRVQDFHEQDLGLLRLSFNLNPAMVTSVNA